MRNSELVVAKRSFVFKNFRFSERRESMAFDDSFIEELRARNDVVELIGSYVNLKRAGRIYKGLCPFRTKDFGRKDQKIVCFKPVNFLAF